jgi:hypothetical protein
VNQSCELLRQDRESLNNIGNQTAQSDASSIKKQNKDLQKIDPILWCVGGEALMHQSEDTGLITSHQYDRRSPYKTPFWLSFLVGISLLVIFILLFAPFLFTIYHHRHFDWWNGYYRSSLLYWQHEDHQVMIMEE